ncbi:hypothetical protein SLEP1_g2578 [Rubroshorea leprosula]|uniref:Uncharacterized protein n=1 Tax=Rubroshorea leprosula TaxID=152421 RepID=A0AAV5HNL1_9ROSI|nr:hypothetical protein SLEP1_g2578 [Rubroshorea leprosula]
MTGFMRNLDLLWVRDEPRADLGSSRTQVYSTLGSTQTQSRSRFVANPSLLCSALGSTQTQVCSGFVANPGLLYSGFDANPSLLWVCRKPVSLLL